MYKRLLTIALTVAFASSMLHAQSIYTNTFDQAEVKPNTTGWAYWFIPTGGIADTLNLKMSYVDKGTGTHAAHSHNHDELFIMVEGEGIINLNGVDQAFHKGDAFYCPSGSEHSIRRADTSSPTKYLMFNRETKGGIKTPYPFFKEEYGVADCYAAFKENKSFWYVSPKQTLGGLNVRSVFSKSGKVRRYAADGRQLVFMVMDGDAEITVGGQKVRLSAMSACFVPEGTSSSVKAVGGKLRYLEARIH